MSASLGQKVPDTQSTETVHRSRWRRFSPSMGWRAFWSEIVIVVLGVAIALAANEAVEEWNWRNKVQDAEVRLQSDLAWAFVWAAEKSVSQPCVDAQLAAMSRNVLESGDALQPMPVETALNLQFVVRMPNRPYRFPVWNALLADGTAMHFTPQRQSFFGRISDGMAQSRENEVVAHRLGGSLLAMREPIPLDPVVRADLLARINDLRALYAYEALNAKQRMRVIADAGSAPPDDMVERFLNADGKHPPGADFSGMTHYCRTRNQPVGDWRDYRTVTASLGLPPGAGVAK